MSDVSPLCLTAGVTLAVILQYATARININVIYASREASKAKQSKAKQSRNPSRLEQKVGAVF